MSLHLAPVASADALELLEAVEESRADMGHISWAPLVVDLESAERMARALGATGSCAVRDDGAFVGVVGLEPLVSLACWVRREEQRQGYAADAARLLIARSSASTVMADPEQTNPCSLALLRRLGFTAHPGRVVHYLHRHRERT